MYYKIDYRKVLLIWVGLLAVLMYSFLTDTILYFFRIGQTANGIAGIAGFMILAFGVAIFAYAGFMFVRNTLHQFRDNDKLAQNYLDIRNREKSRDKKLELRKENFGFLMEAWRPAFIPFGLATLLIIGGAIILNIATGIINL